MTTALAKVAGIADPEPQPTIEDKEPDLETGLGKTKRPPSRISVPLSRRSSIRSQHLDDAQRDDHVHDDDDAEPDFEWGPNHPCFPHMNPHVPLDSPLYQSTRIIRIRRDWMVAGDLAPTFANLYPEILDPLINEDTFRQIIRRINDTLLEAFSPWSTRAWIDAVLGIATLWLWDDAGFTGAKSKLRDLEKWLDEWNKQVGEREGVKIIPLRRTGYLTIDIQIPDPEIEVATRPATHATDLSRLPHPTLSPPLDMDEDVNTDPHRDAPRGFGELGPYPVQDLGTLRQSGQQHLTQTVAA